MRQGINPKAQKQAAIAKQRVEVAERRPSALAEATAKERAFRAIAHDFITNRANADTWRAPRAEATWWASFTRYVFPAMVDVDVEAIGTRQVQDILLQPLKDDTQNVLKAAGGKPQALWRNKPESAGRIRGRIELVLGAAKAQYSLRRLENDMAMTKITAHRKHKSLGCQPRKN